MFAFPINGHNEHAEKDGGSEKCCRSDDLLFAKNVGCNECKQQNDSRKNGHYLRVTQKVS